MTTLSDPDFTEAEIKAVQQKLALAVKLLEGVCAIKDAVKKLKNHPIHSYTLFLSDLMWDDVQSKRQLAYLIVELKEYKEQRLTIVQLYCVSLYSFNSFSSFSYCLFVLFPSLLTVNRVITPDESVAYTFSNDTLEDCLPAMNRRPPLSLTIKFSQPIFLGER